MPEALGGSRWTRLCANSHVPGC